VSQNGPPLRGAWPAENEGTLGKKQHKNRGHGRNQGKTETGRGERWKNLVTRRGVQRGGTKGNRVANLARYVRKSGTKTRKTHSQRKFGAKGGGYRNCKRGERRREWIDLQIACNPSKNGPTKDVTAGGRMNHRTAKNHMIGGRDGATGEKPKKKGKKLLDPRPLEKSTWREGGVDWKK